MMPSHKILVLVNFLILPWAPARPSEEMSERYQKIYSAETNIHQVGHKERNNPVNRETLENSKLLNQPAAKGLSAPHVSQHNSDEESGVSHKETAWLLLDESVRRTLPWLPSLSPQKATIVKNSSHGAKFTLSLDVPLHILKILIDVAKAKQMEAKAAANAELMEQIGRRR